MFFYWMDLRNVHHVLMKLDRCFECCHWWVGLAMAREKTTEDLKVQAEYSFVQSDGVW